MLGVDMSTRSTLLTMDPQWRNSTEQRAWRDYLLASLRLIEQLDNELNRRFNLPLSDYEILFALHEAEDAGLRMSDVAERVIVSRSRLTYRMDRLVGQGFVEREVSPDDRRVVYARLTAAGHEKLEQSSDRHIQDVKTYLFNHLTEEQIASLSEIFGPVRKALEEG